MKQILEDHKSLEAAWDKTEEFLQSSVEDIPIEDLLKHNKLPKKIIRKQQPSKVETAKKRAVDNALKFLNEKNKRNEE